MEQSNRSHVRLFLEENRKGSIPGKPTWRTETSKYPEEQKSIEIPPVAASERGIVQTRSCVIAVARCRTGVSGASMIPCNDRGRGVSKSLTSRRSWEAPP